MGAPSHIGAWSSAAHPDSQIRTSLNARRAARRKQRAAHSTTTTPERGAKAGNQMTKRAKLMAEYLLNLGWDIYPETTICPNCNAGARGDNYCRYCGSQMVENKDGKEEALEQLEHAIKHALKNGRVR